MLLPNRINKTAFEAEVSAVSKSAPCSPPAGPCPPPYPSSAPPKFSASYPPSRTPSSVRSKRPLNLLPTLPTALTSMWPHPKQHPSRSNSWIRQWRMALVLLGECWIGVFLPCWIWVRRPHTELHVQLQVVDLLPHLQRVIKVEAILQVLPWCHCRLNWEISRLWTRLSRKWYSCISKCKGWG